MAEVKEKKKLGVAEMAAYCGILKVASRTAALTKMDFAVLPETNCQGLFHQIHKKSTKKVPEALYGS